MYLRILTPDCLVFTVLLPGEAGAQAPGYLWAQSSTSGGAEGNAIAVDAAGNSYVTGYFWGGYCTFGSVTVTGWGDKDFFVAKYNSSGTCLWAKSANGGGQDEDFGAGIAVDAAGNVYVTGGFGGGIAFGSSGFQAAGDFDIFVIKYDSNGVQQWVTNPKGSGRDIGNAIAVDAAGNAYVTGRFGEYPFNPGIIDSVTFGATTLFSNGDADIFIAKYNTNGVVQWVQQAGGIQKDVANGIALDASGNAYITGNIQNMVTFNSITVVGSSSSGDYAFIAKYDANGGIKWVQKATSTYALQGNGIAVDSQANAYVTGVFFDYSTFGSIMLTANTLTTNGIWRGDIFTAKYDSLGVVQWVQKAGGLNNDYGIGIAANSSGEVYVTGSYDGVAQIGNPNYFYDDIFVTKYNSAGAVQWIQTAGGPETDHGRAIDIDAAGNLYATGGYRNTVSFGAHTISNPATWGYFTSMFLTKIPATGSCYATAAAISNSICQGQNYQFGTQTLTSSGQYTRVIPNAAGCDSTITLSLAVKQPTTAVISASICSGSSYTFGIQSLTTAGTYTRVIPNAAGCDSTITLSLTVKPKPATPVITQNGNTLSVTAGATSYIWLMVMANGVSIPVPGVTSNTYTPTVAACYRVIAITDGCMSDTTSLSLCYTSVRANIKSIGMEVHPNPFNARFNVTLEAGAIATDVRLIDALGREVQIQKLTSIENRFDVEASGLANGVYLLQVKTNTGLYQTRIVKR